MKFFISTWSANFLWSSVTDGYLRASREASMLSLSILYSSNWRLSFRSSHLSME